MDGVRLVVLLVILYFIIGVLVLDILDKVIKEILQERGEDINEWMGPTLFARIIIYVFWPVILVAARGKITKESIRRFVK